MKGSVRSEIVPTSIYLLLQSIKKLHILLDRRNIGCPLFSVCRVDGARIGYWHDTGHAHAQEALSLIRPGELLDAYAHRLLGVHLHDDASLDDHLPPGTGDIAFDVLKPRLKPAMPRVLELKPGTPDADVVRGLDFLRHHL